MANVEDVKTSLAESGPIIANISGDVDSLLAQIAALVAELAAGKVATQADIDELAVTAQGIRDQLATVDAKEPVVPPAPLGGRR